MKIRQTVSLGLLVPPFSFSSAPALKELRASSLQDSSFASTQGARPLCCLYISRYHLLAASHKGRGTLRRTQRLGVLQRSLSTAEREPLFMVASPSFKYRVEVQGAEIPSPGDLNTPK